MLKILTTNIAQESMGTDRRSEKLGGMTKAIETGVPKLRIEQAAAAKQARIESVQDVIVGVNKYQMDGRH